MMDTIKKVLLVISLASIGAFIGHITNLPMGVLVGSFIIIAAAKIIGMKASPLPKKYKQMIQMVIGGLVGLNLQPDLSAEFLTLLIPGIVATFAHLLFALLIAFIFSKLFGISRLTAILGSIPAGMSEISNIVDEVEVDKQFVMLMHLFRVSILVLVLPIFLQIFIL